MAKDYPVGKTQQMVLDALGLSANGFSAAEKIFEGLGITVSSKREGRRSVPVVTVADRFDGGFRDGDGFSYRKHEDIDLTAIEQWIES